MDLELKIISATDLSKLNPFSSKLQAYVVVSISGDTLPAQKTPIDSDGGRNPYWNHPLKFSVPGAGAGAGDLTLKFRIHAQRSFAADKLVGEVCVPLQDLLDSASTGKTPWLGNFVSYQVKKPSGRPNGVLTFSYRFNDKISSELPPEELVMNFPAKAHTTSVGYPAPADVYPPPPNGGLTFSNRLNDKISGEELIMNFQAKPHTTSVVYPAPADVYPPPPSGGLTFSNFLNDKISGEAPREELFMNFPAKPYTTSVVYPTPADVYPPPLNPIQPAMGYPAMEGYSYDVYPPPAAIPATMQTSYGYPAQGGYEYGYPGQTGYGHVRV